MKPFLTRWAAEAWCMEKIAGPCSVLVIAEVKSRETTAQESGEESEGSVVKDVVTYIIPLVYECGIGYVGTFSVAPATVFGLLRLAAMSLDQFSEVGKFERYTINETGRALLALKDRSV